MTLKQKIIVSLGLGIIGLYLFSTFLFPFVSNLSAQTSPVKKIVAENDKVYKRKTKIRAKDFTITALHENGKKSILDEDEYSISVNEPALIGDHTDVTIVYKENDSIKTISKVKNEREPVMKFHCGKTNLKDVTAVLYSNGELCFEGNGDVLSFHEYPWKDYEGMDDVPIQAVTFQSGVKPKSMDRWFADMDTLICVSSIPNSVESMEGTFEGCESLKKGPDWSKCDKLKNVKGCYKDCESIQKIVPLPANIIVAANMCEGCISLTDTSNLTKASSLTDAKSMYQDCCNLIQTSMPPNVKDISYMFAGCINLEDMPHIPESVTNMEGCFEDNSSLKRLTNIPANVENVSSCFAKCGKIEGELIFECNPLNYSNLFTEAAIATKVQISGASEIIDCIIQEMENSNILKK